MTRPAAGGTTPPPGCDETSRRVRRNRVGGVTQPRRGCDETPPRVDFGVLRVSGVGAFSDDARGPVDRHEIPVSGRFRLKRAPGSLRASRNPPLAFGALSGGFWADPGGLGARDLDPYRTRAGSAATRAGIATRPRPRSRPGPRFRPGPGPRSGQSPDGPRLAGRVGRNPGRIGPTSDPPSRRPRVGCCPGRGEPDPVADSRPPTPAAADIAAGPYPAVADHRRRRPRPRGRRPPPPPTPTPTPTRRRPTAAQARPRPAARPRSLRCKRLRPRPRPEPEQATAPPEPTEPAPSDYERAIDAGSTFASRVIVTLASSSAAAAPR